MNTLNKPAIGILLGSIGALVAAKRMGKKVNGSMGKMDIGDSGIDLQLMTLQSPVSALIEQCFQNGTDMEETVEVILRHGYLKADLIEAMDYVYGDTRSETIIQMALERMY